MSSITDDLFSTIFSQNADSSDAITATSIINDINSTISAASTTVSTASTASTTLSTVSPTLSTLSTASTTASTASTTFSTASTTFSTASTTLSTVSTTLSTVSTTVSTVSTTASTTFSTTPAPSPTNIKLTPEVIGWIGLSVAIFISGIIAYSTILWLRHKYRKYHGVSFVCGLALMLAFTLTFVLPIDVFTVSYVKDNNGQFKTWVINNTLTNIQKFITYTYFTLYGSISLFIFGVLPFLYFLYDDSDIEDGEIRKKYLRPVLPTLVSLVILGIIFLCGAFIPIKSITNDHFQTLNETNFSGINPKLVSAIGYAYSFISIAGIIMASFYTAYGLSHTPLLLLRFNKRTHITESNESLLNNNTRRSRNNTQRNADRYQSDYVRNIMNDNQITHTNDSNMNNITTNNTRECSTIKYITRIFFLYPLKTIFGLCGVFISVLITTSLCVVCIDKWKNGSYQNGYILLVHTILNPADFIITKCQKFFPLDYVIFSLMFATLLTCSLYSIKSIGIRLFLVKLYAVRPGRSNAQALTWFSILMLFMCFSFGSILYNILPTYMTYGHQNFIPKNSTIPQLCNGSISEDICIKTRISEFLNTFLWNVNFFGSIIFYALNFFFASFIIGIFVSLHRVCVRRQLDDSSIEEDEDLLDDEDDLLIA